MNAPKRKRTTSLVCYVHRKKFAEVHLNLDRFWPVAFDFCPECESWMLRNMERDVLGLRALPFEKAVK